MWHQKAKGILAPPKNSIFLNIHKEIVFFEDPSWEPIAIFCPFTIPKQQY
jgi:hypothetical protein